MHSARVALASLFAFGSILPLACSSTGSPDSPDATTGVGGTSASGAGGGSSGHASGHGGTTAGHAGAAGVAGGNATGGASGKAGNAGTGGSAGASGNAGASENTGGAGANGGSGGANEGGNAGSGGTSGSAGANAGSAGNAAVGGSAGQAGSSGNAGASGGGMGGAAGMSGGSGGSAGASCVPTQTVETLCNDIDDDCDGFIDNVDVGHDGVCDCLRIGIVGIPGANPSSDFQAWLQALGTTVSRVNTMATDTFDANLLANFDIAIFDRLVRPYTSTEADALRVWVEAGGGFVTMSGYANNPDPDFLPNVLLTPFGLSYGGPLSVSPATMFVSHPLTQGLSSITFDGGYVVTPTTVPGGTSTAFAANADGWVGYAHERMNGRGVVWGDEWIEFDSEWSTMPQIQTFWVNIMSWVGPRNRCMVPKP